MESPQTYRLQMWLAALQVMLTLGVILLQSIFFKMLGYTADFDDSLSAFIRHGSFALVLLSPAWVIFTIKREASHTTTWTRTHTLISGILLGALMVGLAALATKVGRSYPKGPIQHINEHSSLAFPSTVAESSAFGPQSTSPQTPSQRPEK